MPSAFAYPLQGDTYNWAYETEPEPHMDGRRVSCPRGRVIGGSSSINGMVYIRGHPKYYDGWAAARGLEPWSYAHCVPYFKRSETRLNGADDYHGGDGPLYVTTGEIKVSQVSKCACTVRYSGRVRVHGFQSGAFCRWRLNLGQGKVCEIQRTANGTSRWPPGFRPRVV